eukprot:COSAG01_NODE_1842_length_9076_cov_4.748246_2_plen_316_part_00
MFAQVRAEAEKMPKKNIKKNLEKRGLSTKGSHDVLLQRLLAVIEDDHERHKDAWFAEQAELAEELAEREAALAHLGKMNKKFTKLKAPGLRKQLEKRGLSTKGKKTVLLERLADALEVEYADKREQEKRIEAEEARIAEIAGEQEAADAEFKAFKKAVKKMKKAELMKALRSRKLDVKGSQEELSGRLLEAVTAEKEAADDDRRHAMLSEEEKLAKEIAEQEAEQERQRVEAEEALAEQLAEEEAEAERLAEEESKKGAHRHCYVQTFDICGCDSGCKFRSYPDMPLLCRREIKRIRTTGRASEDLAEEEHQKTP